MFEKQKASSDLLKRVSGASLELSRGLRARGGRAEGERRASGRGAGGLSPEPRSRWLLNRASAKTWSQDPGRGRGTAIPLPKSPSRVFAGAPAAARSESGKPRGRRPRGRPPPPRRGTDFNIDSLPLPRKARHDWALFHEESPKNNYKLFHKPIITLFNYTATFSRHSHLPLTTQYLEGVEVLKSRRYLVPLQSKNHLRTRLAPLVYVQSDCDPPSDRDSYVRELMAYIEVDSYGECLRNRDLPEQLADPASMDADGFYRILAQYKFILAFENAVCDDYITEKFWRPLKLGVVPVYHGSPSIADWLPSNRSAILVSAFSHPRELAGYIRQLDRDDGRYAAYIEWKLRGEISNRRLLAALAERRWGVQDLSQDNHIDAFECMVCTKVWDNIRLQEKGLPPKRWQADVTHLSCPEPTRFSFSPLAPRRSSLREMWIPSFQQSKKEAQALRRLVDRNQNFSAQEFWALVFKD
nr:alpha-(1,3)-fucosyltransferase 10 isoform X7 [Camelus dromedarius]